MIEEKKRIEIIDALRGLAVVLMVAHHFLYNLVWFLGAPSWMFSNPVFDILQYFFAGLFIFLSGVSSRFSRGNIRRGLIAIVFALIISGVTYCMDMPIWFGVLHLLGFSMVFFGLTHRILDLIPRSAAPFIFIALIAGSSAATANIEVTAESPFFRVLLSIIGWYQQGFISYDYFPLFPWLFVSFLGTWAGRYITERKLPDWFYCAKFPVFPKIGRRSFIIYILHQPVLYGLVMGVKSLFNI